MFYTDTPTKSNSQAVTKASAALSPPAFDADEAADFLALLGGIEAQERGLDPLDIKHSWVAIGAGKPVTTFGTLAAVTPWITAGGAVGSAVFIAVNRFDGRGRKASDCGGLRALVLDCDDGVPDVSAFPLAPSLTVTRGHPDKAHFYWLLRETGIEHAARWVALQQALIARYNGDPAVKDLSRAMRIPGSVNFKDGGAAPVTFSYAEAEDGSCPAYTFSELEAVFPPVVRATKPSAAKTVTAPLPASITALLAQAKTAPHPTWAKPPVVISMSNPAVLAKAKSAIDHLGAAVRGYAGHGQGERDAWVGIGFAIAGGVAKDELSDEDGLELFKRFSAYGGDDADDDAVLEAQWRGFNADGSKGLGSLFHKAAQHGWVDPAKAPVAVAVAVATGTRIEDLEATPLPSGFVLKDNGWVSTTSTEANAAGDPRVCGAVEVLATVSNDEGTGYGKLLRIARGGVSRTHILDDVTAYDARDLSKWLIERGVGVAIRKDIAGDLRHLFSVWKPQVRVIRTGALGWRRAGEIFVMPHTTVGTDGGALVAYDGDKPGYEPVSGTLADWQVTVAEPLRRNPYALVALGTALSGPLLKLVGEAGSILHLIGKSSSGKTTIAMAAASVWGHGKRGLRAWDATVNGIEAAATASSDTCLLLDELTRARDGKGVADAIYLLANGQGKARMTRDVGSRPVAQWAVPVISTGETDFMTFVAANPGPGGKARRMQAGQLVRALEVRVDDAPFGAFNDLAGYRNGRALSEAIAAASQRSYGTAGEAFVAALVEDPEDAKAAVGALVAEFMRATGKRYPALSDQGARAAKPFALAYAALRMATLAGVLPFEDAPTLTHVLAVFGKVVAERGYDQNAATEEAAAVEALDEFLVSHGGALAPWNGAGPLPRDAVGFEDQRHNGSNQPATIEVYLTREGFRKMCNGLDPKTVAAALVKAGRLKHAEPVAMKLAPNRGGQVRRLYEIGP